MAKPSRGSQDRTWPDDQSKLTVGDAAGWVNPVPSPEWKATRGGTEGFIPSGSVPKGIWSHSSSFTEKKGGGKCASWHLSPSPEVRALGFRLQ